ncbi:hypothetical protein ACHAWF_018041 [Thalassiosira exigua]
MPKRSRASESNPLSAARKELGNKNGGSADKADQNARSLWHRKSGAGNHLFISYYGSQPMGVVAVDAEVSSRGIDVGGGKAGAGGAGHSTNTSHARGMSRAAKKRRKKKKSNNGDGIVGQKTAPCTGNGNDIPPQTVPVDESHPLVQAFVLAKNRSPHLSEFVHALSRPLPLTLRFRCHDQSSCTELKERLCTEYSELVSPVSFDPSKYIFQSTPGSSLCKSNLGKICPKLKELIVEGSSNGTIARQEMGSMLPVLCLRSVGAIEGGSKVLDLCASPGSKTMQALEVVCPGGGGKRGKVVANDVHSGRLSALQEALLRSGLPESITSRVTYTNHDASHFPTPKSGKLFDAIICDVPCGGDGTIRKDKHILPMWSPNISNSIHGLQLSILLRALQLVKPGGTVCYSTCSLNPIEDEAVVSAALGRYGNCAAYELLDWPEMLPGFRMRPGALDWKVSFYDHDNVEMEEDDFGGLSFFGSYKSAQLAGMKDARSSFWPDSARNERIQLDRCRRLLPQDQDTGGFFVALIRRIR